MTDRREPFRQFIFGETVMSKEPLSPDEVRKLILKGIEIKETSRLPSQEKILSVFSRLSEAWSDRSYARRREAADLLIRNASLSREFISAVLDEFPNMLSAESMLRKIEGELGNPLIQEEPVRQGSTKTRLMVQPAGTVLHVASGNVFLACVDSIIDGIITKNVNFLKMSSDDRDFPVIFAESIKDFDKEGIITGRLVLLWWRRGDRDIEDMFKQAMDRIVFWGGGEALLSWQTGLGPSTVLISHGPKVSFGIVSKAGLESAKLSELTDRIAFDVTMWEQRACNCPQTVFIEESVPEGLVRAFTDSLSDSFRRVNSSIPPSNRSDDEYTEILKARELAVARSLMASASIQVAGPDTFDWTIIYDGRVNNDEFGTSPLNRTLGIKRYLSVDTLPDLFKGHSFYLQTAGYCLGELEISKYAKTLAGLGVTRVCPFGIMAIPTPGAPHDGSYSLRGLTRFTVVE